MPAPEYCPRCAARRPFGARICQTCGLDLWKRPHGETHPGRHPDDDDLVAGPVTGILRWLTGTRRDAD